ncbi:MAG: GNAT family N-acetyltransferase [Burkholderiales bacterium]
MKIVVPTMEHLPGHIAALKTGWSPDTTRGAVAARETLAQIASDPTAFVARQIDREAAGAPVVLPDGSIVPRLPGVVLWLWDGEFCGIIGLRWQHGTEALPPHCLGHIGYAVVPRKRRRGYATLALRQMLPLAKAEGLRYAELTTDVDNIPSQCVIEANGGLLFERFIKPVQYGATPGLRYRIPLA